MHTILRFFAASMGYMKIMLILGIPAALLALAGGTEAGAMIVLFTAIFFAPGGFINTWDDFGD